MGKTADNEAIKLRATWLNNTSVGAFVGGFAVPYFAYSERLVDKGPPPFSEHFAIFSAFVVAWAIAFIFRRRADQIIKTIKD